MRSVAVLLLCALCAVSAFGATEPQIFIVSAPNPSAAAAAISGSAPQLHNQQPMLQQQQQAPQAGANMFAPPSANGNAMPSFAETQATAQLGSGTEMQGTAEGQALLSMLAGIHRAAPKHVEKKAAPHVRARTRSRHPRPGSFEDFKEFFRFAQQHAKQHRARKHVERRHEEEEEEEPKVEREERPAQQYVPPPMQAPPTPAPTPLFAPRFAYSGSISPAQAPSHAPAQQASSFLESQETVSMHSASGAQVQSVSAPVGYGAVPPPDPSEHRFISVAADGVAPAPAGISLPHSVFPVLPSPSAMPTGPAPLSNFPLFQQQAQPAMPRFREMQSQQLQQGQQHLQRIQVGGSVATEVNNHGVPMPFYAPSPPVPPANNQVPQSAYMVHNAYTMFNPTTATVDPAASSQTQIPGVDWKARDANAPMTSEIDTQTYPFGGFG